MLGAICKIELPLASILVVEVDTMIRKKFVYRGDEGASGVWAFVQSPSSG